MAYVIKNKNKRKKLCWTGLDYARGACARFEIGSVAIFAMKIQAENHMRDRNKSNEEFEVVKET